MVTQITGYLRLPQVLSIIPVSRSTWWEGCRTGRYPKPVKLGPRVTAWKAEDIYELVQRFNIQAGTNINKESGVRI